MPNKFFVVTERNRIQCGVSKGMVVLVVETAADGHAHEELGRLPSGAPGGRDRA